MGLDAHGVYASSPIFVQTLDWGVSKPRFSIDTSLVANIGRSIFSAHRCPACGKKSRTTQGKCLWCDAELEGVTLDPDPNAYDENHYEDSLIGSGEAMLQDNDEYAGLYENLSRMRERNLAYKARTEEADLELAAIEADIREFERRNW